MELDGNSGNVSWVFVVVGVVIFIIGGFKVFCQRINSS